MPKVSASAEAMAMDLNSESEFTNKAPKEPNRCTTHVM